MWGEASSLWHTTEITLSFPSPATLNVSFSHSRDRLSHSSTSIPSASMSSESPNSKTISKALTASFLCFFPFAWLILDILFLTAESYVISFPSSSTQARRISLSLVFDASALSTCSFLKSLSKSWFHLDLRVPMLLIFSILTHAFAISWSHLSL